MNKWFSAVKLDSVCLHRVPGSAEQNDKNIWQIFNYKQHDTISLDVFTQ